MIHEHLQHIITYLHTHPHWGWAAAFTISFIESLAIIGTIVPGSVTMTAIGALVGSDVLPAGATYLWAIAGAYAGDCISYWFGRYYGESLTRIWPFYKYPKLIPKGEEFFKKHGGKSILIGRFAGPVRSVVPMIAGILNMSPMRFLPVALITAILWAVVYMTPGVILGALSLELPPKVATEFIAMGLLLIALIWGCTWFIKFFFDQTWYQIDRAIIKWWNYLNIHKNSHWITQLLRNPAHEEDHQQLVRAVFTILFSLLFLFIGFCIASKSMLVQWNLPIFNFLQSIRIHPIDNIMITLDLFADEHVLLIVALIIFLWLAWSRRWWPAFHWFLIVFLSGSATLLLKNVWHVTRPPIAALTEHTSSIISTHTILTLSLAGFLAVLIADTLPRERRSWIYLIAVVLTLFVALSRLYLGAHWLTDILASICLGMVFVLLITISYRRHNITPISPISLALIAITTTFVIGIGYSYFNFQTLEQEFTISWPVQTLTSEAWWQQTTGEIPFYRLGRTGQPIQPFNIQWLEPINNIKNTLIQQGWQEQSSQLNLHSAINRFLPGTQQKRLPIIPALYHNRSPALILIKEQGPNQPILMLRLWQSDILINNGESPLWLGTLYYYQPPIKVIALAKKSGEQFTNAINSFIPDLQSFQWKKLQTPLAQQPLELQKQNWDGLTLLIRAK